MDYYYRFPASQRQVVANLFSNPKYYMDFVVLTGIRSFHLAKYGLNTTNSVVHRFFGPGLMCANNKKQRAKPAVSGNAGNEDQNSTFSCAPENAAWPYRLIYIYPAGGL